MSAPLRLAIFDVDGTLVDSQQLILAAMSAAFAAVEIPLPSRAETLSVVGLSLPLAISTLCPNASEVQVAHMVEVYKQAYATGRHQEHLSSPLYPRAKETLETLWQVPEILLGVATGKSRRGLDYILNAHQLTGRFATEQVADHHPSKPHPSMVLAALSESGVEPAQAVMIGDTSFDMEMGRAAGVRCVGVTWGYHGADRLIKAGADAIVDDFDALSGVLWD